MSILKDPGRYRTLRDARVMVLEKTVTDGIVRNDDGTITVTEQKRFQQLSSL